MNNESLIKNFHNRLLYDIENCRELFQEQREHATSFLIYFASYMNDMTLVIKLKELVGMTKLGLYVSTRFGTCAHQALFGPKPNLEFIKFLVEVEECWIHYKPDHSKKTCLHIACSNTNCGMKIIKYLISCPIGNNYDFINDIDSAKNNIFQSCLKNNKRKNLKKLLKLLVKNGADINYEKDNYDKENIFDTAVEYQCTDDVIKYVGALTGYKRYPTHFLRDGPDIVSLLLDKGLYPDDPITATINFEGPEAAELFIERGILDPKGSHKNILKYIDYHNFKYSDKEILKLKYLVLQGSDINAKKTNGIWTTVLGVVCTWFPKSFDQMKKIDLIKFLLEHGADPNLRQEMKNDYDRECSKSLHFDGSKELVLYLKNGINVDYTNASLNFLHDKEGSNLRCYELQDEYMRKHYWDLVDNGVVISDAEEKRIEEESWKYAKEDVHYYPKWYIYYYITALFKLKKMKLLNDDILGIVGDFLHPETCYLFDKRPLTNSEERYKYNTDYDDETKIKNIIRLRA
jgi:ankyrin repeat protein